MVKLRDHPLMTRRSGRKAWPPLWVNIDDRSDKPKGEIGVLTRVGVAEAISNGIFVRMSYGGSDYVGAMYFDDEVFCREIYTILESMIGGSLHEIGNLDLTYTL